MRVPRTDSDTLAKALFAIAQQANTEDGIIEGTLYEAGQRIIELEAKILAIGQQNKLGGEN